MFLLRCFLMAVLVISTRSAYSNIMVAPTHVEMNLDRPRTESILVINNNPSRIKVSIEAIYNDIKDTQHLAGTKPGQDNLSPYIKISPKMIKIEPGKGRNVRLSVRPGQELKGKTGEYRAHILFKTVEPSLAQKKNRKQKDKKIAMSGQVVVNLATPVYGSIGKGSPNMHANCILEGKIAKMNITNSGLWRFDGWVKVYDPAAKDKEKPLAEGRVFMPRESIRNIILKFVPQSGKQYDLKWELLDQDKELPKELQSGKCVFVAGAPATL